MYTCSSMYICEIHVHLHRYLQIYVFTCTHVRIYLYIYFIRVYLHIYIYVYIHHACAFGYLYIYCVIVCVTKKKIKRLERQLIVSLDRNKHILRCGATVGSAYLVTSAAVQRPSQTFLLFLRGQVLEDMHAARNINTARARYNLGSALWLFHKPQETTLAVKEFDVVILFMTQQEPNHQILSETIKIRDMALRVITNFETFGTISAWPTGSPPRPDGKTNWT